MMKQIKDISRETEKNKGIAPIYVTNYYKWRFFAFDLYVIKDTIILNVDTGEKALIINFLSLRFLWLLLASYHLSHEDGGGEKKTKRKR